MKTRQENFVAKTTDRDRQPSEAMRKEATRPLLPPRALKNRVYDPLVRAMRTKTFGVPALAGPSLQSFHWRLGFGSYLELGAWSLELGTFNFSLSLTTAQTWLDVHLCAVACTSVHLRAHK